MLHKILNSFLKQLRLPTSTLTLFLISISAFAQINTSTNNLYSFRQVYVGNNSDVQFYQLEAENLTANIQIIAESPFMVSLDCYEHFENILIIPNDDGVVSQRIFVRAFPESTGNFNVKLTHSSDGMESIEISVHVQGVESQAPANYYSNATSTGSRLKTELHNIINNHNVQTYSSLWTHFVNTDATFSGKVWDMYSDIPCDDPPYIYTFFEDQDTGTGGNVEGDFYNREHSFPRSWFGGSVDPMQTDLHHIYPVDKWVNNFKAAYPLAVIENPTGTSLNGSKKGNITVNGYSGLAFEVIDEYKGDLARAFLYMITRYEDRIRNWQYSDEGMAMLDNLKYPGYKDWALEMLIQWHEADPVSQKEIERNNAVYVIQGNRNPFIDHPEFVNKIWVDTTETNSIDLFNIDLNLYPNPSSGFINFCVSERINSIRVYSITGNVLEVLSPENRRGTIDISMHPAGLYFVRFLFNNEVITKRVIID